MKLRRLYVAAWLACVACGVQPVELLPTVVTSVGEDEYVVGQVPASPLARLRSQRGELGEDALRLLYPAAPELVIPADIAPITFEWRSEAKGKPSALPAAMPMAAGMAPEAPGMPAMPGAAMPPPAAEDAEPEPDPMANKKASDKAKTDKASKDQPVLYELRLYSEVADVRVYVAATNVAFPRERWRALLSAHRSAVLNVAVRGVRENGDIVHGMPLQLRVQQDMPAGVFYSFSTTTQGMTRAQLSDSHERVISPPAPLAGQRCSGCHTLSRDGKRALVADANSGSLYSWQLQRDELLRLEWPASATAASGYVQGSFDAAATRIAATRGGQLFIFNADTGTLLDARAAPLTAAVAAPDWSPNGRAIVVETGTELDESDAGSLATLSVGLVDGSLSPLTTLIEATGDEQLRSPTYSPDGEWIAYERRMGPERDAKDSKLFIVRATGGEPIELRGLAQGMKPMDGASSPSFAEAGEPGHVYMLFSSRRAVGSITLQEGQRQLFAAELDLSLAADGKDPSHAAFWLPFQQRTNSYLRTQWGRAYATCTPNIQLCSDVKDSCGNEVGDECCTPAAADSCDDQIDNDCDGAVDEGCGCALEDVCGNQLDDDCDLRVDEKPCAPAPSMR
jgi:hypothetical protein